MARFPSPLLQGEVELTEERERHIASRHPELLPEWRDKIAERLADPTKSAAAHGLAVLGSSRAGTRTCGRVSTSL